MPRGWSYSGRDTAANLHAELLRGLPPGHVLTGREVEIIAWREGAIDDVLFRDKDEPDRFTLVHLSWLGRTAISSEYPSVEFDGTFTEVLAMEKRLCGLTPPEE